MKNYIRQPWVPPVILSWRDLLDWFQYHRGVRLYGMGLRERTLLFTAVEKVCEARASFYIEGWLIGYDAGEVMKEPKLVRAQMKKKTAVTLRVCCGVGVSFQMTEGYGNVYGVPEVISVMYIPELQERAEMVAKLVEVAVNQIRQHELGRWALSVWTRLIEVQPAQLALDNAQCLAEIGETEQGESGDEYLY